MKYETKSDKEALQINGQTDDDVKMYSWVASLLSKTCEEIKFWDVQMIMKKVSKYIKFKTN